MSRLPLCLLALMLPSAAMAHAMLEHAQPSAGAQMRTAPSQLRLDFSEPLEPAFSGVNVTDSANRSVTSGTPAISGTAMTIALKAIPPGEYRVQWHAVSVDTHRTEGSYSFTVRP